MPLVTGAAALVPGQAQAAADAKSGTHTWKAMHVPPPARRVWRPEMT
jgi:hypothetical protein